MATNWIWQALGLAQPDVYESFAHINRGIRSWFTLKPIYLRIVEAHREIAERQGKPFAVNLWAVNNLILPPRYLSDLRQADGEHVNFFAMISDAFRLHASVGDMLNHGRMIDVVKRGLSSQLPSLMPIVKEELDYAFKTELGSPADWQLLPAQQLFGSIAQRAISRIVFGPELCRDDDFVKSTQSFVASLFLTTLAIVKLPLGPLRHLATWPMAFFHRRALGRCVRKLEPVVKKRIQEYPAQNPEDRSADMISWTLALSEGLDAERDAHRIATEILHDGWAASSTPGGLVTEMVYRLILNPEYLEPMRAEAEEVIKEHGWSEKALNSLVLQDSFIRETNRVTPTSTVVAARKVVGKPFVLSDGLTLPPGTRIGFVSAVRAPGDSQAEMKFDGFRFAKMTSENTSTTDGVSSKWAAATMAQDNLVWGYGNHCCPGRFFAVRVVKLVFTVFLLEYEVESDGVMKERPPAWEIEGQFIPNMNQKIRVRKRKAKVS